MTQPPRARQAPPDIRETHSGIVVLIGDRAYKFKKPVDLGFLDFTSISARRDACERELRLNRRLAPDVYLDVAQLTGSDGAVLDHLVVMRRMPDDARLSTLVHSGAPVDDELRSIARVIAAFHATAERSEAIAEQGRGDALLARWRHNLTESAPLAGGPLDSDTLDEITQLATEFVLGRTALFDARADAGLVVDGHGDLLAEDVFCLPDGPRVLDCLEFDDLLRWVDVLDDVACLAMDLERLGRPELSQRFLRWYSEFAGTPAVPALEHHYLAYRAFVRAKVSCIRAAQGDAAAVADVRVLLRIALAHLRAGQVRLILVGGAPATGKSTVAALLAERLDAVLISSDDVRTEQPAPLEHRYTAEQTARVYALLLDRARTALSAGVSVVVDATWPSSAPRAAADRLAQESHSRLATFECQAPLDVCAARAQQRHDRGDSASEADAVVARTLASLREPWPQAVPVNGLLEPRQMLHSALEHLGLAGAPDRGC